MRASRSVDTPDVVVRADVAAFRAGAGAGAGAGACPVSSVPAVASATTRTIAASRFDIGVSFCLMVQYGNYGVGSPNARMFGPAAIASI